MVPSPPPEAAPPAQGPPVQQPPAQIGPQPPTAKESQAQRAKPEEEKKDDGIQGLLGPFQIGPVFGVGLPNLLSFGATMKIARYVGVGVNVGMIPTLKISYYGEATVSYGEYDIYGRVYPFGGSFFFGAGVGYEHVTGTSSAIEYVPVSALPSGLGLPVSSSPFAITVNSEASVRTMVLTPQIGIFHTFDVGFSIGADIGMQIPIAASQNSFATQVSTAIPSTVAPQIASQIRAGIKTYEDQYAAQYDQQVNDTLNKIGHTPIPTFNVRIGWLL
jgi:hypothetical protein